MNCSVSAIAPLVFALAAAALPALAEDAGSPITMKPGSLSATSRQQTDHRQEDGVTIDTAAFTGGGAFALVHALVLERSGSCWSDRDGRTTLQDFSYTSRHSLEVLHAASTTLNGWLVRYALAEVKAGEEVRHCIAMHVAHPSASVGCRREKVVALLCQKPGQTIEPGQAEAMMSQVAVKDVFTAE